MTVQGEEMVEPIGLDRRSLLKRGAAAGAIGLAAPITFDSFFSPAAAASGPDVVATPLVGDNAWLSDGNTSGTPDGARTANGSNRYMNANTFSVAANSLVLVAFSFHWTQDSAPTFSITGGALSFASGDQRLLRYDNNTGGTNRGYLGVAWAASTGALSLQQLIVTLSGNKSDNFSGQVIQLTAGGPVPSVRQATTGTAALDQGVTGTVTPADFSTAKLASTAEIVVASSLVAEATDNSPNGTAWAAPGYSSSIATNYSNEDSNGAIFDVAIASFLSGSTVAAGSRTVTSTLAGDVIPAPTQDMGAILLEIDA